MNVNFESILLNAKQLEENNQNGEAAIEYYSLGCHYSEIEDFDNAIQYLMRSIELASFFSETKSKAKKLLSEIKRKTKTDALLNHAIIKPKNIQLLDMKPNKKPIGSVNRIQVSTSQIDFLDKEKQRCILEAANISDEYPELFVYFSSFKKQHSTLQNVDINMIKHPHDCHESNIYAEICSVKFDIINLKEQQKKCEKTIKNLEIQAEATKYSFNETKYTEILFAIINENLNMRKKMYEKFKYP